MKSSPFPLSEYWSCFYESFMITELHSQQIGWMKRRVIVAKKDYFCYFDPIGWMKRRTIDGQPESFCMTYIWEIVWNNGVTRLLPTTIVTTYKYHQTICNFGKWQKSIISCENDFKWKIMSNKHHMSLFQILLKVFSTVFLKNEILTVVVVIIYNIWWCYDIIMV